MKKGKEWSNCGPVTSRKGLRTDSNCNSHTSFGAFATEEGRSSSTQPTFNVKLLVLKALNLTVLHVVNSDAYSS